MTQTVKMRPGAHYAGVAEGVYFRTARGTFVLRGPSGLLPLVDRCVPLLEDGTTEAALTDAIGGPRAHGVVKALLSALSAKGMLLDLAAAGGPPPAQPERARFGDVLAHLETHGDAPFAGFRRLRATHADVVGPLDAACSLADGLADIGVGRITVHGHDAADWPGRTSDEHTAVAFADGPAADDIPADHRVLVAVVEDPGTEPPGRLRDALLAGHGAVAVLLTDDMALVSPYLTRPEDLTTLWAAWTRARAWFTAEGPTPARRPLSAVIAGSLASHHLMDAVGVGRTDRPEAAVVTGAQLTVERVALPGPAGAGTEPAAAPPEDEPADAVAALVSAAALGERWSGLFSWEIVDALPQLPVANTPVRGRVPGLPATLVGFGPDQAHAGVQAMLDALRLTLPPTPDAPGDAVAAAGVDPLRRTVDGALRLLSLRPPAEGEEQPIGWDDVTDLQARRLWRALRDYEDVDFTATVRTWDALGWCAVRLTGTTTGETLAWQWGDTPGDALHMALAQALSRRQSATVLGTTGEVTCAGTVVCAYLPTRLLRALAERLHALPGTLRTSERPADPVLGRLPLHSGWMWWS